MARFGLVLGMLLLAAGCSTSRRVVVQDGYQGVTQVPRGFEAKPARPGGPAPTPDPPAGDPTPPPRDANPTP